MQFVILGILLLVATFGWGLFARGKLSVASLESNMPAIDTELVSAGFLKIAENVLIDTRNIDSVDGLHQASRLGKHPTSRIMYRGILGRMRENKTTFRAIYSDQTPTHAYIYTISIKTGKGVGLKTREVWLAFSRQLPAGASPEDMVIRQMGLRSESLPTTVGGLEIAKGLNGEYDKIIFYVQRPPTRPALKTQVVQRLDELRKTKKYIDVEVYQQHLFIARRIKNVSTEEIRNTQSLFDDIFQLQSNG